MYKIVDRPTLLLCPILEVYFKCNKNNIIIYYIMSSRFLKTLAEEGSVGTLNNFHIPDYGYYNPKTSYISLVLQYSIIFRISTSLNKFVFLYISDIIASDKKLLLCQPNCVACFLSISMKAQNLLTISPI